MRTPFRRTTATSLASKYASVPGFSEWRPADLQRLEEKATELEFEPGEVISKDITSGTEWVMLVHGSAVVEGGALHGMTIGLGEHLGELSIFSELRSTSMLVATTYTRVLVMSALDFRDLLITAPSLGSATTRMLARQLHGRLRGRGIRTA